MMRNMIKTDTTKIGLYCCAGDNVRLSLMSVDFNVALKIIEIYKDTNSYP